MADKEYVDREVLLEFLQTTYNIPLDQWMARNYWSKVVEIKQKFISCIEKLPASDVAEVVRCEHCKHCKMVVDIIGDPNLFCGLSSNNAAVQFGDFCSYGERKEATP